MGRSTCLSHVSFGAGANLVTPFAALTACFDEYRKDSDKYFAPYVSEDGSENTYTDQQYDWKRGINLSERYWDSESGKRVEGTFISTNCPMLRNGYPSCGGGSSISEFAAAGDQSPSKLTLQMNGGTYPNWQTYDNIRIITQPKESYSEGNDKPIVLDADGLYCRDKTASTWLEGDAAPYHKDDSSDTSIFQNGFKMWAEKKRVYLPKNIKVDYAFADDSCTQLTSHIMQPVDFGEGGIYNSYMVHAQSPDNMTAYDYSVEFPK